MLIVNGEVIKIESISEAARRLHGSAGNIEEVIDAKGRTFKGWMIFSERNFNGLAIKQSLEEYNEHPGSINTYLMIFSLSIP
ncbi:hypothetical protein DKZ35_05040 [Limosilactobacillus reuteri]|uniref:Uncharacterized protein n=1 Tax=Limosilactobacillus reuteri TaxID=1598 RepID=A0ABD6Y6N0_LIMRT|nr:hypothetical protein DKZ35_05040 [Limosilactobacillus reuteri]